MDKLTHLLDHQLLAGLLEDIEFVAWLIATLLFVQTVLLGYEIIRRRNDRQATKADWGAVVEAAYDTGDFEKALGLLETYEQTYPESAVVKYWQGRCYFRQERWETAAEKFETSCRLEPPYRQSVRDYMAFIELNELVPGIEGYLDRNSEN